MRHALVLGGGGVAGIAWEIGLLVGLAEAGIDVTDADLVVGTSAGSAVGTMISSGADLDLLYSRQLAPADPAAEPTVEFDYSELMSTLAQVTAGSRGARDARARIGAYALTAAVPSEEDRWQIVAGRLPVREWPRRRLMVVAVEAETGDWVAFDRDSGVHLVDAVAASSALPGVFPPVTVDHRRYVDGGMRSVINADLAEGHERVLILAPVNGLGIPTEVRRLERAGSRVLVVAADEASRAAFGSNILDPAIRADAARAGRAQAAAVADSVRDLWKG
ncbi:NTE family protein [Parafrankia irregularis]|uniref:NTE family protein n=1 Tax=Parafrankia irregularis TaxID=795642 RepID=A0A0S4QTZ9_9ACTN|nr:MULTISPECIES: patatin-like phospholipase family protein [Parafrankia]MBE3205252.1 patatin-like phospholipase family protein [Parafrankia sp. CH37]CUU58788.1 NTE family protein [Parafrankia irregularis]